MTDEFDSQLNKPLSAGTVIRMNLSIVYGSASPEGFIFFFNVSGILEARQSDDYLNLAKDIKFLERLHKFQLKNKEVATLP
eukprot:1351694-Amorphochlora_amoeboformis.AAC.1